MLNARHAKSEVSAASGLAHMQLQRYQSIHRLPHRSSSQESVRQKKKLICRGVGKTIFATHKTIVPPPRRRKFPHGSTNYIPNPNNSITRIKKTLARNSSPATGVHKTHSVEGTYTRPEKTPKCTSSELLLMIIWTVTLTNMLVLYTHLAVGAHQGQ